MVYLFQSTRVLVDSWSVVVSTFQFTIGVTAVPTLPQWTMIALMALLVLAGFAAMRRRTA